MVVVLKLFGLSWKSPSVFMGYPLKFLRVGIKQGQVAARLVWVFKIMGQKLAEGEP